MPLDDIDRAFAGTMVMLPKEYEPGDEWLIFAKREIFVHQGQKQPLKPGLYIAIANSTGWQVSFICSITKVKGLLDVKTDEEILREHFSESKNANAD